jgi:hypothetical protein
VATTKTSYAVIALEEAAPAAAERGFGVDTEPDRDSGRRGRVYVRRDLDIGAFGVNAFYQGMSGAWVVGEHDELTPGSSGHEELYVVVAGACTFTVNGEEMDARHGTALFVRDPAAKRSARATEDGTIVLAIGGRPGEAFTRGPGESLGGFYRLYRERDFEGALPACREALGEHPGNAMIPYNIACLESLLGRPDQALDPLGESLAAWPEYKELVAGDEDLSALRDDPRFQALLA